MACEFSIIRTLEKLTADVNNRMVALASVALTIVHPAFFLPAMRTTRSEEKAYGLSSFVNSTGAIST